MIKSKLLPDGYKSNLRDLRLEFGYSSAEKFVDYLNNVEGISIKLRSYSSYERDEVLPPISLAIKLADLYGVTLDYLLGRSACRSIDNGYINQKIGLSDKAIEQLERYKEADDSNYQIVIDSLKKNKPAPPISMIFLHLPIINFLLSSASFQKFLERFFNYAIDWYQVPILKDGEQFKVFPSYENDTEDFLYFGCNPNNPLDNVSMKIDSDFRKTISKNLLELSLDDLAQEYKKLSKIESEQ
jgi:transcriptional regulator with XRE-family HTH domain